MSKKKKRSAKQTLAQMQAELKPKVAEIPAIVDASPKIDPQVEESIKQIDNEPFRWCFLCEEMRWNGSFSFHCYKKDSKKFLKEIEQPIYKKYHSLTWTQVNKDPHCGEYGNNLSERQREIARSPHKPDDEQLYHIHISQKHVLFGYRLDNVLHITINDPEHEFNNL